MKKVVKRNWLELAYTALLITTALLEVYVFIYIFH